MDTFPDIINRSYCTEKIEEHQNILLKKTRELFTQVIRDTINDYQKIISLQFDNKLSKKNRIIIMNELLKRFGEISVTTITNIDIVINYSSNIEEYDMVKRITIRI
ncbi:hypothetical protein Hokovirus_1_179 [Hokovirus HKV1]|uniref:Uncharacterized protein n=1 Tax=Hokovirus HKV1 TaxID=1977638 RepID=A0A1V0SF02_9VIRU|nr:hypothetical protein Hokovirus_1_179 [Hokovirus HKV1]